MIILLKNESPEDPYLGLPGVEFVPVLNHTFIDLPALDQYLACSEAKGAEAVVVTSQRAVEALSQTANVENILNKPVFTVGPATADRLRDCGFLNVKGENTGNGQTLSDEVLPQQPYSKYIFFTGVVHRDIIPKKLESMGATVIQKVVYDTTSRKDCTERLREKVGQAGDRTPWVVFFSPSGVKEIVEELQNFPRDSFKIASIGPTTEAYLRENQLIPDCVSEKPTPQHLHQAIKLNSI